MKVTEPIQEKEFRMSFQITNEQYKFMTGFLMKKILIVSMIVLVTSMFFGGCKTTMEATGQYNQRLDVYNNLMHAFECKPYFQNDTCLKIYFSFYPAVFQRGMDTIAQKRYIMAEIELLLYHSIASKMPFDTVRHQFRYDINSPNNKRITDSICIGDFKSDEFYIKTRFFDPQKKHESSYINLFPDPSNEKGRDYFRHVCNDGSVGTSPVIANTNKVFQVEYSGSQHDWISVHFYQRDFPVADPPFVQKPTVPFDYTPDSVFLLPLRNNRTDFISLNKKGFYHFQTDTLINSGFTLFCLYNGYPAIKNPSQMIGPLRYIATNKEYKSLESSKNIKAALDTFWLDVAGNKKIGRNFIQKYYNRVLEANFLFFSYHEGWKTDRGMIYIIFGKPDIVYFEEDMEHWIYGEEQNWKSLEFSFIRVVNPFSYNDFSLIRSAIYEDSWFYILQTWRR